jgi:hypothetical protein
MSGIDVAALISDASKSEIGESLIVLVTRPYCRISLVARRSVSGYSLFIEAVTRHDIPLTTNDLASRRALIRRFCRLGFLLVEENGSKIYEKCVDVEECVKVMTALGVL